MFYHKKGVHFELKSQCFITKKGSFCAEKSVFCCKKGGHLQTGEQGWVAFFSVIEGAGICQHHISARSPSKLVPQLYFSTSVAYKTQSQANLKMQYIYAFRI